jgi:hypothetical protein
MLLTTNTCRLSESRFWAGAQQHDFASDPLSTWRVGQKLKKKEEIQKQKEDQSKVRASKIFVIP